MSWFKCPNQLIDDLLPELTGEELKIIIFMQRKTAGWQKTIDRISRSQIVLGTGLSEATVKRKLKTLESRGLLCRVSEGTGRRSSEWMVTIPETDEPEEDEIRRIEGATTEPPENVGGSPRPPRGITENRLQPVEGSHRPPQKTILKYTYSKERPPDQAGPALAAFLSDRDNRKIRASGISPPYLQEALKVAQAKNITSAAYIIATGKNMETENKLTNGSQSTMKHKKDLTTYYQEYQEQMRTDLSTIPCTANEKAQALWQWLRTEYAEQGPLTAGMITNDKLLKLVSTEGFTLIIHATNWNIGQTFKRAHIEGVRLLLKSKHPKANIEVLWD